MSDIHSDPIWIEENVAAAKEHLPAYLSHWAVKIKNRERRAQLVLLEQSKRGQAAAAEVAPWGLQPSCPLAQ